MALRLGLAAGTRALGWRTATATAVGAARAPGQFAPLFGRLASTRAAAPATRSHAATAAAFAVSAGALGIGVAAYAGAGGTSSVAGLGGLLAEVQAMLLRLHVPAGIAHAEAVHNGPTDPPGEVVVSVPDLADLPLIALAEVRKHTMSDSLWVTYDGVVYDVTSFLDHHPGGRELLLTAAGMDLGHFFDNYTVHGKSHKAAGFLQGMAIGRLSAEEALEARARSTPQLHIAQRLSVLGRARRRMALLVASVPLWFGVRLLVRVIGFFIPPLAHFIAHYLPVSVPGYAGARKLPAVDAKGNATKVAVIGGGIAGSGAAYTLAKSGYDVSLFEARDHLSGNAHTFDWDVGGKVIRSCVSVTAWPGT